MLCHLYNVLIIEQNILKRQQQKTMYFPLEIKIREIIFCVD